MNNRPLRIIFAGTPAFAAVHLETLLDQGYEVIAVYTQPDRPSGRGRKLKPGAVKALAVERSLPVLQPERLGTEEELQRMRALAPDLMVVVAYGLILPAAVLDIPRLGCINVHASLLPRWRGAAPVERAILAGDRETGVTIMQMDRGLDTGDILNARSTPISLEDNSATVTERLAELGRQALVETMEALARGGLRPRPRPQDDALSTYAPKLTKDEALIDWRRPAESIRRQVCAFYPRLPAYSFLDRERIRILKALPADTSTALSPGTIAAADKSGLVVACGDENSLLVQQVQLPGKAPVDVAALLNSRRQSFAPGARFSSPAEEAS